MSTLSEILDLTRKHENLKKESINLVATKNAMSPLAKDMLKTDFGQRYCVGTPQETHNSNWLYPGVEYIAEIEKIGTKLGKELFGAGYFDFRPLSGSNAIAIILHSLTDAGNKIMRLSDTDGGHFATLPLAKRLGLKLIDFPYDKNELQIDVDRTIRLVEKEKPSLLIADASHVLFPHPVREITNAVGDTAPFSYDGSQVLGLIAGGQFQKPIEEGVCELHGATHKTFPGPQKSIICRKNDDEVAEKIRYGVFPALTSNSHLHHILALIITMLEMKEFGEDYAKQTISNAKALATYLCERGFRVSTEHRNFTESQQVWVESANAKEEMMLLGKANIFVNCVVLPSTSAFGLRLGTQEMTRYGMKEKDMEQIAEFMKDVIIGKKDIKVLKEKVINFRKDFQDVKYCLTE